MRKDKKSCVIFALSPSFRGGIFYLSDSEFWEDRMKKYNIRRYVILAMFAALAYASLFALRISGIGGFLTFDVKDAVITVCAMLFGPVAGVVIALLVSLLEMITVSGTGPWGFLMNFVGSAVFAAVGSAIYCYAPKLKKTLSGAIVGLMSSVLAMTLCMLVMNILVTPIYFGISVESVKEMLLPLLLPFNLIKATLNAAIVLVLYKPLSTALKKMRVIDGKPESFRFDKKTILLILVGLAIIVACVLLLILALNGQFHWHK